MAKKKLKNHIVPFRHDEDGAAKFKICFFAVRGIYPKYAKGLEELRVCNRIVDKLEAISDPAINPKEENDEYYRELSAGDQVIEFLGHEFSKFKQMVSDDGIGWPPSLGRDAEMTIDWLNSPFEEKLPTSEKASETSESSDSESEEE